MQLFHIQTVIIGCLLKKVPSYCPLVQHLCSSSIWMSLFESPYSAPAGLSRHHPRCFLLKQEHIGQTVGRLMCLRGLGWGREQICLVCSAASEAFGATRTLSAPIQHAKSEEVGCRSPVPLDFLIPSFPVFMFWRTGTRLAVMSVSGWINRCLFGNASLHV